MRLNASVVSAILFVILFAGSVCAQEKRGLIGFGVSAGAVNYAGELDDNFTLKFTRLGFGLHTTALFFPRLHVRLAYFHGSIGAKDSYAFFSQNKFRNLSFFTDIDELSLSLLYKFTNRKRGFSKRNFVTPYLFAGVAGFMFNPKAELNGRVYELQKVGTEGQNLGGSYPKPYPLQEVSIPFGAGFVLKITEFLDFGGECGFRKTFTDYIDDVSTRYPVRQEMLEQEGIVAVALSDPSIDPNYPEGRPDLSPRGNPADDDWYIYTNVHLTYYITTMLFKPYRLKNQFRDNTCKGLNTPKKLN